MDIKDLLNAVAPTREEIEQVTSPDDDVIFFLNTQDDKGEPKYVYISVKARRAIDFTDALKAGEIFDLREYGTILKTGPGDTPTPEVITEMKEIYDADTPEEFSEKLAPEVQKRVANYLEKMAEDNIMNKIAEMKKAQSGGEGSSNP